MPYEFSLKRRVEFHETDMAGIMHFSNYFRFMEVAESAFYRSLGFSVVMVEDGTGWPRVHVECDYAKPLRFEEEVEIRLLVLEKRRRSVAYLFKFLKQEGGATVVAARGKVVVVCAHLGADGRLSSVALPAYFDEKVQAAPAELAAAWQAEQ
jgi:YbgC/YbaW family acyl-CoA thioester hydrolase